MFLPKKRSFCHIPKILQNLLLFAFLISFPLFNIYFSLIFYLFCILNSVFKVLSFIFCFSFLCIPLFISIIKFYFSIDSSYIYITIYSFLCHFSLFLNFLRTPISQNILILNIIRLRKFLLTEFTFSFFIAFILPKVTSFNGNSNCFFLP